MQEKKTRLTQISGETDGWSFITPWSPRKLVPNNLHNLIHEPRFTRYQTQRGRNLMINCIIVPDGKSRSALVDLLTLYYAIAMSKSYRYSPFNVQRSVSVSETVNYTTNQFRLWFCWCLFVFGRYAPKMSTLTIKTVYPFPTYSANSLSRGLRCWEI